MIDCRHLEASTYAVEIDGSGVERRTTVHLCGWCDANRAAAHSLPTWAAEYVTSGGPNFNPARHCGRQCKGYEPFDAFRIITEERA